VGKYEAALPFVMILANKNTIAAVLYQKAIFEMKRETALTMHTMAELKCR